MNFRTYRRLNKHLGEGGFQVGSDGTLIGTQKGQNRIQRVEKRLFLQFQPPMTQGGRLSGKGRLDVA